MWHLSSRRQLQKLKFYVTFLIVMMKINQSIREKSLCYNKKGKEKYRTWVLILRVIAHQTNIWRMVCTHGLQMAAPFCFWTLVQWTFISGATRIYQPDWTWSSLIGRTFGIERRIRAFWFSIGDKSRLFKGPRLIPARKWSPESKLSSDWPANDARIANDPQIGPQKIPGPEMVTLSIINALVSGGSPGSGRRVARWAPGHLHNDVYKYYTPYPKARFFNKKPLKSLPWG